MNIPQNILNSINFKSGVYTSLAKDYIIFVDTSFWMEAETEDFLLKVLAPLLIKENRQIVLPIKVHEELLKIAIPNKYKKTEAQTTRAKKGLKIIQKLRKMNCIAAVAGETDTYVDNLFVAQFTTWRLTKKLCLLTQDSALAAEIVELNKSGSSGKNKFGKNQIKGIKVYKIYKGGLVEFDNSEKNPVKSSSNKFLNSSFSSYIAIKPFSNKRKAIDLSKSKPITASKIPTSGSEVENDLGEKVRLGDEISDGAEGIVYKIGRSEVGKIFKDKKFTNHGLEKLKLMVNNQIIGNGICWPKSILYNDNHDAVGYIMERAKGTELHKRLFLGGPKLIEERLPDWNKSHLVTVCINILKAIDQLHKNNVLIGDLNGRNIMLCEDCKVYIVDTDSFQLEGYPCPVGQPLFTAPEIQKKEFKSFLRTIKTENFSIATMLFMILMPGKPPYAQQEGGMITENILKGSFSYPFKDEQGLNAPKGPWRYMWSNLPYDTKKLFVKVFADKERIGVEECGNIMQKYLYELKKGYHNNEIKPLGFKEISDDRKANYDLN